MFHRLIALITKELQTLLSDRQSRALLIMPVILQIALFPWAATLEVKNSTLAILNQDSGRESIELIQRLAQARAFPHLIMLHGEDELRMTIDEQKAVLVLRFAPDFSRQLSSGRTPTVQAIIDGRRSNAAQIAFGYAQNVVSDYLAQRGVGGAPMLQPTSVAREGDSTLVVRHQFNPNLDYQWFIVPSLVAIITTLGSLIVTALSVAREREQGTFDQLLVSPLSPGLIMTGKAVPAILVALVQATIILLAGVFLYGIPFAGSVLLLYPAMFCYALSLVGLGLLISSVCSTQQQAFLGVFSLLSPAILLSGYIAPIENMPPALQVITWANPLRHFIPIVKGLYLKDIGFAQVWLGVWPMLLIATVTLSASYWMFRRRSA